MPVIPRAGLSFLLALMSVRLADEWFTFFPAGAPLPIRDDLDLSYAQAGVVLISLMSGGLLGHGFTVAADYVDRRWLASLGALGFVACMIAFALADSFLVLVAAGLMWGAASDAFVHGCEVALVDLYREDLAPVLARVNALGSIGDLLGPLTLAAAAAVGIGWRAVFAAGGGLMVLYAVWLASHRFPRPSPPADSSPLAGILDALRDPRVIVLALVAGLFGVLDEPFWGFTIAYLDRVRGLPESAATAIVAVGVTGGFAGFVSTAAFTRRFAARGLLLVWGALVGVAVAGIIALPVAVAQAAAAFLFGFAGAVFWAVLQARYLALRPGQAGTTGAVVSTIGLFGIGFPPLVGAVSDAHGLATGLAVYAAVPAVMLGLLVVNPSATRDRKT